MRHTTTLRALYSPNGNAPHEQSGRIAGAPATDAAAINALAGNDLATDAIHCASDRGRAIALHGAPRPDGDERGPLDIHTNIAGAILDYFNALAAGERHELAIADTRGRVIVLTPTAIIR